MEEIVGQGIDNWPAPVKIFTEKEKLVRLTGLPLSLKGKAWGEIKLSSPPLANLLKDQSLRDIVEYFSAEIFIESEHAPCLPPERLRGRSG